MEEKVSVWKANITNGLIFGLIYIVYTLIMYFLDLSLNRTQGYVFLAAEVIILYLMVKSYRDSYLHGYIKYGQSVGAGVVIFLYFSVIVAVFTYILYKFIDPGLIDRQLTMAEEILSRRGMNQEMIDASMNIQKKIMIPEFIALASIVNNMFMGTIMSLLVSIFTRKEGNPLIDIPENQ